MINDKILEELLQKRLGPYRDRDVLHETRCQMSSKRKLVLYSFVLECNGHVVGLDESERPLEGRDDRTFRFRGLLKIANPDWLSDFGVKTVETELNLRASVRALREGDRSHKSQLTLAGLFESGLLSRSDDAHRRDEDEAELMVEIQGEENMAATFMRSQEAPNGLLWSSKAHNRKYQIATMDVETYSQSENFFWRWRLFALMEKICKSHPYIHPKKRSPIWFVDMYLKDYARPPEDKHRRLIFDAEDSDVDEKGYTKTPRHLLVPHTSEILGLFAAHVEWLIAYNESRSPRLFDTVVWGTFWKKVRSERKEADRHGVRWGRPVGQDSEEGSGGSGSDNLHELVRKNPVIGKPNKVIVRRLERASARSDPDTKMISSDSESEGDGPGRAEYVSDFSEPSDAGEEMDYAEPRREEDEVMDRIPWELQQPPFLPDVDGRWCCPLQGCHHQIDLRDLADEQRDGVPEELVEYILQKQWRNAAYDRRVLRGFEHMVTNHYLKHFEERGVRIERRDGKMRVTPVDRRERRRGGEEPIRGPMPVRGTLGGESRVVPIVHARQAAYFR